jgi:hypothetical protein
MVSAVQLSRSLECSEREDNIFTISVRLTCKVIKVVNVGERMSAEISCDHETSRKNNLHMAVYVLTNIAICNVSSM